MDEETKRREEIETRLEEERMLRQEQERRWQEERMQERHRMEQTLLAERQATQQQMQTMFSYLQGIGATINYQPPPMMPWPPPPLGLPSIFSPSGAAGTPVSMNMNLFTLLAHTYSNFEILYVNISCAISERTSRLT